MQVAAWPASSLVQPSMPLAAGQQGCSAHTSCDDAQTLSAVWVHSNCFSGMMCGIQQCACALLVCWYDSCGRPQVNFLLQSVSWYLL